MKIGQGVVCDASGVRRVAGGGDGGAARGRTPGLPLPAAAAIIVFTGSRGRPIVSAPNKLSHLNTMDWRAGSRAGARCRERAVVRASCAPSCTVESAGGMPGPGGLRGEVEPGWEELQQQ